MKNPTPNSRNVFSVFKNSNWGKLKTYMMILTTAFVMYSCSNESISDDMPDTTLHKSELLTDTNMSTTQMRLSSAGSCETDCIEPGSSTFYPFTDMATASSGINTKTVSYEAYNTETDFVVEVTYTITEGPTDAKAIITIDIEGDEVEYKVVDSGSTVSHMVPLADGWAGCDEIAFSVKQIALGVPITFSGSYALFPVCTGVVQCGDAPTAIVEVLNPATGKTWMDRNLGAAQVATSSADAHSYGDLYQWGRRSDGHQCRTSGTTTTLSSTDQPGHGDFIITPCLPDSPDCTINDWRSPQNNDLWQGVNGINNPCPSGYRLPTNAELNAERLSWSSNDAAGAFASPLKLPAAGRRSIIGSVNGGGSSSSYWSGTVSGTNARSLNFFGSGAGMSGNNRAFGQSVRCIKD